ncbi:MAG: polysaccharide biosynthesis C-terminal domain-containing protein [Prolixibacteraceae bacterium]|nr:polysaccharide biosynthesis C-terminal domain-containing protein [Prolixibacteraceae bacterium]
MKAIKKLTGETAIYGMPSIIGRFLNWWLNPYWTHIFLNQAELGTIINVYAYVAFLFVILTYGMETGFFRFAAKSNDQKKVFSTSVLSLIFTSFSFVLLIFAFRNDVATALEIAGRTDFVMIMAVTVAFDVISTIPFAKLRLQHRPVRFAYLKFINIGLNIGFNLFFLSLCPYLAEHFPNGIFSKIYIPNFGIGYVFLSNLIASVVTLVLLLPEMKIKWKFDIHLLKKMLGYSFPIFIVGITGMINQNIDKILLPKLLAESLQPLKQLGIYGTAFKMAVLLNMFIQAFRFAFEPFFFSQTDEQGSKKIYALVMKYFSIFGMVIFLGISTFIDLIMKIVSVQYREGAGVVPIILLANFFMGIYFTLSLWYKITDKTRYGAFMGILGSAVTIVANILLIPYIGYYGSAVAILLCFVIMTATSYLLGKRHYPVPYNLKNFFFYLITGTALFLVYWFIRGTNSPQYGIAAIVNLVFWFIIFMKEKKQFKALFFQKD